VKGGWHKIYDGFNEEALRALYECFVKKKLDRKGRYLEYRVAQWLTRRNKAIDKIDIDKRFPKIGEIDVVGYDKKGNIICIAECKARKSKASKEDIDPWLKNVELMFNESKEKLQEAYFVNVAGFTDGIKNRMLEDKKITKDGKLIVSGLAARLIKGAIYIGKLTVDIYFCEERGKNKTDISVGFKKIDRL